MIQKHFSKHYKRMEEDLKQFRDFTPAMLKIISINLQKLEEDVLKDLNEGENHNETYSPTQR